MDINGKTQYLLEGTSALLLNLNLEETKTIQVANYAKDGTVIYVTVIIYNWINKYMNKLEIPFDI